MLNLIKTTGQYREIEYNYPGLKLTCLLNEAAASWSSLLADY